MQLIEKAIRQALSKIDIHDNALRRRVYRSAWDAQERYLRAQLAIPDEEKDNRRQELRRLILAIENEHVVGGADLNALDGKNKQDALSLADDHGDEMKIDNTQRVLPNPYAKASYRNRPLLIMAAIIGCLIIFIGWSFYNSLVGPTSASQNKVKESHPPIKVDQAANDTQNNLNTSGWIQVFKPDDIVSLTVEGSAKAVVYKGDDEHYVRLAMKGTKDRAVIDIGGGSLTSITGKKITVDVVIRASDSTPASVNIQCDFGNGFTCGRRRFEVSPTVNNLLFNIELPQDSRQDGKLFLASDSIDGKGTFDIFAVFIRAAD